MTTDKRTQRYTRSDALKEAKRMRQYGWPGARVVICGDGAIITTHRRGCACGLCPTVKINGQVQS